MFTTPRYRHALVVAFVALSTLSGCASVLDRANPKDPLAEFGTLPPGTAYGYAEFVHSVQSSYPRTMAQWAGPASETASQLKPEGSFGIFRNFRDSKTNQINPWRVRLLAPVGLQKFTVTVVGTNNAREVTVPVEGNMITPVQVEWKIQTSGIGGSTYTHTILVGQPIPYTPPPPK